MVFTEKQKKNKMIAAVLFWGYIAWNYLPNNYLLYIVRTGKLTSILGFLVVVLVALGLSLNNKTMCIAGAMLSVLNVLLQLSTGPINVSFLLRLVAFVFFLLIFISKKIDPFISGIVSAGLLFLVLFLNSSLKLIMESDHIFLGVLLRSILYNIAIFFTGLAFRRSKA